MKVRKVDLVADEFIVGVTGLPAGEIGVYCVLNFLMYSSGGPVHESDERIFGIIKSSPNAIRPAIEKLVARGKVNRSPDGYLFKGRVGKELDRAETRMTQARDNGQTGGRPRKDIDDTTSRVEGESAQDQDVTKPEAFSSEKLSPSPSPSLIKDISPVQKKDGKEKTDFGLFFDDYVWPAYPERKPDNPKKPARLKFIRLCNAGEDPHAILAGVKAYAANPALKVGTEFVKTAEVWLNKECWKDQQSGTRAPDRGGAPEGWSDPEVQWLQRLKSPYWSKHQWGPKDINDPDCKIPRHVYEHWVSTADVGPLVQGSQQVLRRA